MKKILSLALWAALALLLCGHVYAREPNDEHLLIPSRLHRPTKLMEDVGQSVVRLTSPRGPKGFGTGFVLRHGAGTVTVTNRHVCALAAGGFIIAQRQDKPEVALRILRISPETDLCLLEGVPGLRGLELARRWDMKQDVRVLGHPGGGTLTETEGKVLGFEMVIQEYQDGQCPKAPCILNFITQVMNVPVWPGSSGSPMVDEVGRVVGVVWAVNPYLRLSFAVPVESLKEMLASASSGHADAGDSP